MRSWMLACFSLLLLVAPSRSSLRAQDSIRIVILSDRVGTVIDAKEREQFHLFSQFTGFDSAMAFQTPDKKFFVRVARHTSPGTYADTVVGYNETTLLTMAEKIDHFEDLEAGRYTIGQQQSSLRFVGGGVYGWSDVRARVGDVKEDKALAFKPIGSPRHPEWWESYPEVSLGIGFVTDPSNLSGMSAVFDYYEALARVPPQSGGLDARPLPSLSLGVQMSRHFLVYLEVGSTFGQPRCTFIAATLSYTLRIPGAEWARPFLGACLERNSFKVVRSYSGMSIESVTIEGAEFTGGVRGGAMLMMGAVAGVNLLAAYTLKVDIPASEESLGQALGTLGGFRVGLQLFIRI